MEIALLPKSGIRIKGKKATIAVDSTDKVVYEAVLALAKSAEEVIVPDESVLIFSVGEFEVGGIKITGIRSEAGRMIYSALVDGISILIGGLNALEKTHSKLQEHDIVVVDCEEEGSSSFVASLASNVVVFYGPHAAITSSAFGKDAVKIQNKYSNTKDKLPIELETVLLG
ncbi:MAG TPA: hypothetical protein VLF20_02450 [Patescibacteria group bacterium]|nr:hypothetical protein [Patescibacteria group bacterium]